MLIKLLTIFGLIEGIILEDFQNELYYTIRQKSPFDGRYYAKIYYWTNVGRVMLNDDGTVNNSYIQRWCFIRKHKPDLIKEAKKILATNSN